MKPLIAICVILFVLILGLGTYRTWILTLGEDQQVFNSSILPTSPLNGDYKGSAGLITGTWKGKRFYAPSQEGINLFRGTKLFRFKTYVGKSINDKNKDVLILDYNIDDNAFIFRPFLDEIVEIKPGFYIGKSYVRLIPEFPFALTFFRLEPMPYEPPSLF